MLKAALLPAMIRVSPFACGGLRKTAGTICSDRMNPPNQAGRWWLVFLAGALVAACSLNAQHALYVEYKDRAYPVRKVHNGWVTIDVDGKAVEFIAPRSALQEVAEYLPIVVAVKDGEARSTGLTSSRGGSFNNTFRFEAEFTSPVALNDVFIALELDTEAAGKRIVYREIGELQAGVGRSVGMAVPSAERLGPGKYRLHVFAGGREVFSTKQPTLYREAMLDKMVAKRIADVQQANPKPFITPAPEYPAELRKAGPQGEAAVKIRILPNGAVADPVVERASDPAFGEAALTAIRGWRFLPRVEGGRPVEIKVSVPFEFSPPKESPGKKG